MKSLLNVAYVCFVANISMRTLRHESCTFYIIHRPVGGSSNHLIECTAKVLELVAN